MKISKNMKKSSKDTTKSAASLDYPSGFKPDELPSSWYNNQEIIIYKYLGI